MDNLIAAALSDCHKDFHSLPRLQILVFHVNIEPGDSSDLLYLFKI